MIKQQAIFMALLVLALPAGADVIVLTDGTRFTNVRVTSESLAEVKYTTSSGTARSVTPGAKVRLILRDDLPEGYENGQRYLRSGDYRAAITEFQAVASAAGGNLWLSEYSYFKLAEAYRLQGIRRKDSGSLSDAVGAYNKLIEQNGQSRFLFVAHLVQQVLVTLIVVIVMVMHLRSSLLIGLMLPLAVPAVVLGFGYLTPFNRGWYDLRGSLWLVLAAQRVAGTGADGLPEVRRRRSG